jgi:hypothetical protein
MEKLIIKREPIVRDGLVVGKDWVESDRILHQRFVEQCWRICCGRNTRLGCP